MRRTQAALLLATLVLASVPMLVGAQSAAVDTTQTQSAQAPATDIVAPQGEPRIDKPPRDPEFGVSTRRVGLQRRVAMYQWVREGDGYGKQWREARVDSSGFAPGHENPRTIPLPQREWHASVSLDGKPLADELIETLGQWHGFRPGFTELPGNMSATFQPEGDGLGSADNPLSPKIGDLRITWRALQLPPLADRLILDHGVWTLATADARVAHQGPVAPTIQEHATMTPKITLLFAALHALLLVALSVPIFLHRLRNQVGVGDGGNADFARRIRVHANFIEYVPLALLLLLLLELGGLAASWLYAFGAALLLARILHAIGLSRSGGKSFGRLWGTSLTWLDLLAMAGAGLWLVLR